MRVLAIAAAMLAVPLGTRASAPSCDWLQYGREPGHSFRQSEACSDVTPWTVPTMHVKWVVPVPDSVTASPAVSDGTVYVGAWTGRFYALDAETGAERWHYDIDDPNGVAFGRIVSSAAITTVGGTKVVVFGGGATLYVLDAATGAKLTSVCVDPRATGRCEGSTRDIEIESSPSIVTVDGETWIVVGMDVHNGKGIGRTGVLAFRLSDDPWTLDTVWKFDPENEQTYTPDNTTDPLTEGAGTGDGCGGVWGSPAVDVADDLVFFGTSSCSYDGVTAGESMWAIGLRDGAFVWTEAPVAARGEGTRLDDDFGASPNLLPGGAVGFGGKDGWYYGRARTDGAERFSTHAGQSGHATEDFAVGGMIGTAAVGEVFDEPAIFATTALSTPVKEPFGFPPTPGMLDERLLTEDPGRMLSLHAISAIDGRILWRQPLSRQSYGAPTYARGVLFVPSTFDFTVEAFDADTGIVLWKSPIVGATSSSPTIVGDSIYLGSGTRTTDAEYKQFGQSALEEIGGPHVLSPLSGIWAFETAL